MKKFEESDVFVNKIKAHPKVRFFVYAGRVFYDNTSEEGIKLNEYVPPETIALLTEAGLVLKTEDGDFILIE
jgi:hypothetical protein